MSTINCNLFKNNIHSLGVLFGMKNMQTEKAKRLIIKTFLSLYNVPYFSRPVFILSAPRSGSSSLYESLSKIEKTLSLNKENDKTWWKIFPYNRLNLPTDYIYQNEISTDKVKAIKKELILNIVLESKQKVKVIFDKLILNNDIRYIEKTIANCFHLDVIDNIFPDAMYIHLVRDARACISSMIEGWNSGFFMKRNLPFPKDSTISHWCYPVPPNWQDITHKSLEEICAWSWVEHNRYVLDKYNNDADFRHKYIKVSYENLVVEPLKVINDIAEFTGLEVSEECIQYISSKTSSWSTVSKPKADKWKEKNLEKINNVLPTIYPMMKDLGYQV